MAKTIKLNYEGVDYTLEFTRRTASQLEEAGFQLGELGTKPVTMIPLLYEGAFWAHHRMKNNEVIWKIYEKIGKKEDFARKLAEMYADAAETLFDEPEEDEKNAVWETNW